MRSSKSFRLPVWSLRLGLFTLSAGAGACSPAGGYDVQATVLEAAGEPSPRTIPDARPGGLLGAGARVRAGAGGLTLGLVPGTVVALGAGGELRLERLRFRKEGARMLGREVDLTLAAGDLDLLVAAPEEAAPTTLRVRTPGGEIVAGPGCLARVQAVGPSSVRVLCARGELRCAGEGLAAGQVAVFPGSAAPAPRLIAGDGPAQRELGSLLERGARIQTLDLLRQAQPPGWRSPPR